MFKNEKPNLDGSNPEVLGPFLIMKGPLGFDSSMGRSLS